MHIIDIDGDVSRGRLGNSMSTEYSVNGNQLSVFWKGQTKKYEVKKGDIVVIRCGGSFPDALVNPVPKNPVRAAAWHQGFYSRMRLETQGEIKSLSKDEQLAVVTNADNSICITYKQISGTSGWRPAYWWYAPEANPSDFAMMAEALRKQGSFLCERLVQSGAAAVVAPQGWRLIRIDGLKTSTLEWSATA